METARERSRGTEDETCDGAFVAQGPDEFARRRFPDLNQNAACGPDVFPGRVESHRGDITREVGFLSGHARDLAAARHLPDSDGFFVAGGQIPGIRAESKGADRALMLEWRHMQTTV